MENKKTKYRVVEGDRLAELLEIEQLANKFGFASCIEEYAEFREGNLSKLVQDELNKYEYVADVLEEYLNAENITDVSDEEKEDMLYVEEFDSCGCGCCSDDYDEDDYEDDDEEEVGVFYVVVNLEDEDEDTDADDAGWEDALDWENDIDLADEFDNFYSESFENSIFKEMEDFVNGKYVPSVEQEQEEEKAKDKVVMGPEVYHILKSFFKNILE